MTLNAKDIAKLIDISAVQAYHGKREIDELVRIAKRYRFIAVHALPCWISYLSDQLKNEPDILSGGPVGFPSGAHTTKVKILEAEQLIQDGIDEMDMMINIGKLKSGEFDYVLEDIRGVVDAAGGVPVKVILEVHYLTEDEIKRGCECSIEGGAEYVKTASGWAATGATVDLVRLITEFVAGAVRVKAAGGVRGLDTFVEMYGLGVERFGINVHSSVEILDEVGRLPGGVVEIEDGRQGGYLAAGDEEPRGEEQ